MKFSIFSVLDHYENKARSLNALYGEFLDQVEYAEQLGFDAYWLGEHHFYPTPEHTLACPNPAIALAAAYLRLACSFFPSFANIRDSIISHTYVNLYLCTDVPIITETPTIGKVCR